MASVAMLVQQTLGHEPFICVVRYYVAAPPGGALAPVGTLHTERAARMYRSGPLAVEAVVDHLRYPDGSTETRVEAEGDEQSVIAFAQELARVVAGIEPALTTKGAELERRLGD